jgi:hypothetical protein
MKLRSLALLGLSLLSTVFAAGAAQAANPLGLAYSQTTNVSLYAKPTGVLVTGRCNRYNSAFASARSKGAEILAYLNAFERPDNYICALDQGFYMNSYGAVPLWPYPSYGQREYWPGTKLTDMRAGGKWILWVVSYVEKLMRERKVDGVFLDGIGGRLWGPANWQNWSATEKKLWVEGNVDLVRRLDAKRRAIDPDFLIISNNVWDTGESATRPIADLGPKYVDGIALEYPTVGVKAYHRGQAGRTYSNLGHRRVLVIGRDATEARAWAGVAGVTHVAGQSHYKYPSSPAVSFKALYDR